MHSAALRRTQTYLQARPEDQEQTAVGKVGAHALAKASGQLLAKKGNGRLDEAALPLAQRAQGSSGQSSAIKGNQGQSREIVPGTTRVGSRRPRKWRA
jgi:hypothetical protein